MAEPLPVCNYPECGGGCLECQPNPASNWVRAGLPRRMFFKPHAPTWLTPPDAGVASDAPPKAKVLDVGFRFDGGAEYTPTVLLAFPQNDWDARDAFVRAIREGMNSGPTK